MFSKPNKSSTLHRTSPSIIGANCSLAGDISSDGEVHIDGHVVGDVRCVTLVIGEEGGVTGEISAETVRVLGAVTGQITARAVELAKSARIMGDITHETLSVEAGAYVEGRFNRLSTDGANKTVQTVKSLETTEEAPTANVIMLGN
jgi:cytoskeletal protein CcmA (bactofilin family)